MISVRSRRLALASALVLATLLTTGLVAAAPGSARTDDGRVRGAIIAKGDPSPKVKVAWFTADWTYLGARKTHGGAYSLALAPGTYHLQFTDQRPAYDVGKYAPADVTVTVAAAATTVKNVHLHVGAAIGGTVRVGPGRAARAAPGARVVAANTQRNSFETTADRAGRFALGGLPPGTYSVFTYDRKGEWVGKSVYLRKLKGGAFHRVNPRLTTRAGRLVVDLYAGAEPYPGVAYVTAVSRTNGQFWTEKASHGTVTFEGLYPGKYDLVVPEAGGYLGGTFPAKGGKVRSGRVAFGSIRLTQVGATIAGRVVDAASASTPLSPVTVTAYDATGAAVGTATTAADGSFVLGGQLTTQSGITVVAQPGGNNPPYLNGAHYCRFGTATVPGVAVVTGQQSSVGTLALPHAPNTGDEDPTC